MKDGYGKYGESGNGTHPKLGKRSVVEGLADSKPLGSGTNANAYNRAKVDTKIPKVGKPGGPQGKPAASGNPPKVARPGGAQGYGHGKR